MDKNLYDLYYNLYYFKKNLITNGIKYLSEEIEDLLSGLINIYMKSVINCNFVEIFYRFNDIESFFDKCEFKYKFIGASVTEAYKKALNNLIKIEEKISSGNLLELINNYISILINKIINDINNKLLLIKKNYFINELYTENFYLHNLIYKEFIKLIEIFNNNFDANVFFNLQNKIGNMIEDLNTYHNSKVQELMDYYNNILGKLHAQKIINTRAWDLRCESFLGLIWRKKIYSSWEFKFSDDFDIKDIPNYLKRYTNQTFFRFKSRYEKYLDNFVSISNLLYSNLYSYMQNKINSNEKIDKLLDKY